MKAIKKLQCLNRRVPLVFALGGVAAACVAGCDTDKKTRRAEQPALEAPAVVQEPSRTPLDNPVTPEEIAEAEKGIPRPAPGAGGCTESACFTLEKYSLEFGQIKVWKKNSVSKDQTEFEYFDHFEAKDQRTKEQDQCLQNLAAAIRSYAVKYPSGLDAFAEAGYGTRIIARVYDYTANPRPPKVTPSFYLLVNKEESKGRAEWVIRASLEKADQKTAPLACLLPDEKTISAGIEAMKKQYLSKK